MGSNRSQLSSKEEPKFDAEEVAAYDDIENQLIADQSKEIEYLNGIDEPINKADLPVLVKEENRNGPYMNEPMKLRSVEFWSKLSLKKCSEYRDSKERKFGYAR